jgi:uncharacterized protein (TIGR03086 family)
MEPVGLLARAQKWTGTIVAGVHEEDLRKSTPCAEWNVATVLDHLMADLDSVNRVASGEQLDLMTAIDPEAPDRVGGGWPDPTERFEHLAKEAREIWSRPDALDETYKTTRSEMPGNALVMINLVDTVVHGWDLAKATGQNTEIPEDVAEAALAFTTKMMKKGQRIGFDDPVPVADDASATDRLVGWLGRQP